jgi:hypothetical protein
MTELRTAHTADLDADALRAARALLDEVFEFVFPGRDRARPGGRAHLRVARRRRLVIAVIGMTDY